jgi:hypothetical protein
MGDPALALLLSCLAAAPASGAGSEPARLAVLPIVLGASAGVRTAGVLDAVADAATLRPGLRAMSVDEFFSLDGQELADRARECGEDTACLTRQLEPFRASLGLVVIVNQELDPALLGLLLLDAAAGTAVTERYQQVPASEPMVRRIATEVSALLDERGFRQVAQLEVSVKPADAQVTLEPAFPPDPSRPDLYSLPPGPYRVRARSDGHLPAEVPVTLAPGSSERVTLVLEEQRGLLASPWFWVGAAAAVVGAGVAIGVAALPGGRPCICVVLAGEDDCGRCP